MGEEEEPPSSEGEKGAAPDDKRGRPKQSSQSPAVHREVQKEKLKEEPKRTEQTAAQGVPAKWMIAEEWSCSQGLQAPPEFILKKGACKGHHCLGFKTIARGFPTAAQHQVPPERQAWSPTKPIQVVKASTQAQSSNQGSNGPQKQSQ